MDKILAIVKNNPKKTAFFASVTLLLSFLRFKQSSLLYHPSIYLLIKLWASASHPETIHILIETPLSKASSTKKSPLILKMEKSSEVGMWSRQNKKQRILFCTFMKMQEVNIQLMKDIGTRLPYIKQIVKKTYSNVILVAYRGYSDS